MQQQQRAANLQKKIQAGKLSLEPCIFFLKKTELDDGTAAFSDISLGKANIFPEQPLDQGIRLCGYKLCFQQTLHIQNLINVVILPDLPQFIYKF